MAEYSSARCQSRAGVSDEDYLALLRSRNHMRLWLTMFCIGLCASTVAGQENATVSKPDVTYNTDVAPILQKHCAACHRPNDIAPMSLLTYEEVLPFARMIRERVVQRKMPPWHADPAFGEFVNDARLSLQEIATIDAWVKSGTKRGEAAPSSLDPGLAS